MKPTSVVLVLLGALLLAMSTYGQQPPGAMSIPAPTKAPQNPANGLTNADVIKMVEAKLGDELIISKIKSSTRHQRGGTEQAASSLWLPSQAQDEKPSLPNLCDEG